MQHDFYFQIASTLADLRHHLRPAGGGKLCRHGLLHHHSLHDAVVCRNVYCMFPLANEQGSRPHHVLVIFCLCSRFTDVRIQHYHVSVLIEILNKTTTQNTDYHSNERCLARKYICSLLKTINEIILWN